MLVLCVLPAAAPPVPVSRRCRVGTQSSASRSAEPMTDVHRRAKDPKIGDQRRTIRQEWHRAVSIQCSPYAIIPCSNAAI